MARRGKIRQENKKLLGEKVLYIGNGNVRRCPCGTGRKRGMMSRHEDVYYCSEGCIETYKK